jgi:hypothetical protein
MKREDIPRCPVPDERVGQKGDLGPVGRFHDNWSNPSGHDVYQPSPADSDPMSKYTVPDCSYKGYDPFTWPNGQANPADLPGCCGHQPDDIEEIKPKR